MEDKIYIRYLSNHSKVKCTSSQLAESYIHGRITRNDTFELDGQIMSFEEVFDQDEAIRYSVNKRLPDLKTLFPSTSAENPFLKRCNLFWRIVIHGDDALSSFLLEQDQNKATINSLKKALDDNKRKINELNAINFQWNNLYDKICQQTQLLSAMLETQIKKAEQEQNQAESCVFYLKGTKEAVDLLVRASVLDGHLALDQSDLSKLYNNLERLDLPSACKVDIEERVEESNSPDSANTEQIEEQNSLSAIGTTADKTDEIDQDNRDSSISSKDNPISEISIDSFCLMLNKFLGNLSPSEQFSINNCLLFKVPSFKISQAIHSTGNNVLKEEIYALYDCSYFQDGTRGILLTSKAFFFFDKKITLSFGYSKENIVSLQKSNTIPNSVLLLFVLPFSILSLIGITLGSGLVAGCSLFLMFLFPFLFSFFVKKVYCNNLDIGFPVIMPTKTAYHICSLINLIDEQSNTQNTSEPIETDILPPNFEPAEEVDLNNSTTSPKDLSSNSSKRSSEVDAKALLSESDIDSMVSNAELGDAVAEYNLGLCYRSGNGVPSDNQKSLMWFSKSAEHGNALAQFELGNAFFNGDGVDKDFGKAVIWYRKAAEQGCEYAQNKLGMCYYHGNGVNANKTEAVNWFRESAKKGYAKAQFNLGKSYYNGRGVDKDIKKAIKWYRKSAEQGYALAQYNLGQCYDNGKGITQDKSKAAQWYRRAAKQGNAEAQYRLGVFYYLGEGVRKNRSIAINWYRAAAEQGHVEAQNNLGECYFMGFGVKQDKNEAVKWYRVAAEQGFAEAQNNLGVCFDYGDGLNQDKVEAVKWYRKAAEQGNAEAQNNLGTCYDNGDGIDQDKAEAVKWYCKAAEQGNATAQYNLGMCYESGDGITKDLTEALKWYRKAARKGDNDAMDALNRLSDQQ